MNHPNLLASAFFCAVLSCLATQAQMPGMQMPPPTAKAPQATKPTVEAPMKEAPMKMELPKTLIDTELAHTSSGTSVEPPSTPMSMLMSTHPRAGWSLMLHGTASISDIQQHTLADRGANRGADKLFSTNWIMPMAQRRLGSRGQLTIRTMLSLEPATITGRYFPELFQQGETAYGKPIVDGQHPHDFVMELAALYDLRLGERTLLSLYAAPVGDPAIGPTAYPHRLSASEDPLAALGHHQQDSTHIAFNVLTAGLTHRAFRIEVSGLHGAEPTEARWHIEPSPNGHAIDSVSSRLTWVPTPNLTAQYSLAHITSPEATNLTQNQRRQTASVMYNRPLGARHNTASMPGMDMPTANWSNTIIWGQTKNLTTGLVGNSYLIESLLNFATRNYLWTRIESAARTSELLDQPNPSTAENSAGDVQAYSLGYDRDINHRGHILIAPGAQFTLYRTPDPLVTTYGRHPFSAVVFLRLRIQ